MNLSKSKLKLIKSLQIKKFRHELGLFFVEGSKIVRELDHSHLDVLEYYCTEGYIHKGPPFRKPAPVHLVSEQTLSAIGSLVSNDTCAALVKIPKMDDPLLSGITLVLDGINDPGNLGAIIRIADWYGIKEIICSPDTVDVFNPKVIATSKGSFIRVSVWHRELDGFLVSNKSKSLIGAYMNGTSIHTFDFPGSYFLLIGSEASGIRPNLDQFVDYKVTIPAFGKAESLNAAMATVVILDNSARQGKL